MPKMKSLFAILVLCSAFAFAQGTGGGLSGGASPGNGGAAAANYGQGSGTITTTAGSSVIIPFNGMDCVVVDVQGSFTGSIGVQGNVGGLSLNQPRDSLQQLTGKWVESIGTAGQYYIGGFASQQVKLAGPVATGSASIVWQTAPGPCNVYTFAIPGSEAGNGFFGGAVSATTTQTTVADSIQGHDDADIGVVWSGITGSPSGCTLQPQYFFGQAGPAINTGPPLPLTPGTNQVLVAVGPFGLAAQFVYSCATYPAAGTINLQITYKPGGKTLISGTQPQITSAWTSATAQNTALTQTVSGYGNSNISISDSAGSFTGGVVTFEVSNDQTFAAANTYPIQCQQNTGTINTNYTFGSSATVWFSCSANGWSYIRARLSTAITGTGTATVNITSITTAADSVVSISNTVPVNATFNGTQPININQVNGLTVDPCTEAKPFPISKHITTATTTLAVPLVGGKIVYVCGLYATLTGASSETVALEYGTQTTNPCDTGTTLMTPAWSDTLTSSTVLLGNLTANSELAFTAASNQLCIVSTGSTPAIDIWIAYVQQ